MDDTPYDRSGFDEIIRDIRRYLDDADSIFRRKERLDKDQRDYYARTMVLFALSNRIMDLARLVCLERRYVSGDEPVKNKVLFKRLHDHSALSWDLRQEMIALVNFRNKVSHHFSELSRDDLEMMYALIPVYKEFISLMELEHSRARFPTKRNMIIGAVLVAVVLILLWYFS